MILGRHIGRVLLLVVIDLRYRCWMTAWAHSSPKSGKENVIARRRVRIRSFMKVCGAGDWWSRTSKLKKSLLSVEDSVLLVPEKA